MSNYKVGDTVRHPFYEAEYGKGKVIRLYPFQGTILVRWEKKGERVHLPHMVTREEAGG